MSAATITTITIPSSDKKECQQSGKYFDSTQQTHDEGAGHMSEIDSGLYLGGCWNAANAFELRTHNIATIVNMASELAGRQLFVNTIRYKNYLLEDDEYEFILPTLVDAMEFIHKERKTNLLVHCQMGRSRSASAIIAYIMWQRRIPFHEALFYVKKRHSCTAPNIGYRRQLQALQILLEVFSSSLTNTLSIIKMITDYHDPKDYQNMMHDTIIYL